MRWERLWIAETLVHLEIVGLVGILKVLKVLVRKLCSFMEEYVETPLTNHKKSSQNLHQLQLLHLDGITSFQFKSSAVTCKQISKCQLLLFHFKSETNDSGYLQRLKKFIQKSSNSGNQSFLTF